MVDDYEVAKRRLFTQMGYTPSKAALLFFNIAKSDIVGWYGDTLFTQSKLMFKHLCAPAVVPDDVLLQTVRLWAYTLVPKKAKSQIDIRRVESLEDLSDVLRDYVGIEGSFREYSKPQSSNSGPSNKPRVESKEIVCFSCR